MWPLQDNDSAATQSYNDPKIGIWFQEDMHEQNKAYLNMRRSNFVSPTVIRSLPHDLQQVFLNADAATPFGTESYPTGGRLLVNAAIGADGRPQMSLPSISTPSTSDCPNSRSNRLVLYSPSENPTTVNSNNNVGASSVQSPPEVGQSAFLFSSNQDPLQDIPSTIVQDNIPFPVTASPSSMVTDPLAQALTPSTSADAPATEFVVCTYSGCLARYSGEYRKDALRRHQRSHRNEPKPPCPVCQFNFKPGRPDNVQRHFDNLHPGDPYPPWIIIRPKKSAATRRRR